MSKNKVLVLIFSLVVFAQYTLGQNNTNSPYTRFGVGEISDGNSGEQRAMGGVALGLRSNSGINTVNPASYSAVDTMTFMFDMGVTGTRTQLKDLSTSKRAFNANLDYITMQFPLGRNIGFSAGLLPYSFVGYNFYTSQLVKNSNNLGYTQTFSGDGGINQVYTGLAAKFLNHFSVGANIYYMFGTVNNYRSLTIDSISSATGGTQINTVKANCFKVRLGAQYFTKINDKNQLTVGVVYEPKGVLSNNSTTRMVDINDTTTSTNGIYEHPEIFGFGASLNLNKKLTLSADYTSQKWKDAKFAGKTDSLVNRNKLSLGLEYIPNPRGRKFVDHIQYRAGFHISDSYLKVANVNPGKNYGFSFGLGLPLYNKATNTISMLNTSFEYGKIGGTSSLKEDYYRITISMSFLEHWFFKRKL